MLGTGFANWPSFSDEESEAARRVIASNRVNYWTGTEARDFEREFAEWSGSRFAVAMANGTLALDASLRALGIGSGDDVVVTPRTFIASVSSVIMAGARPVFADVDRDSGCLTASSIERVLTPKTRAVLCVHLGGWPCDMPAILQLARDRSFFVIEDCAQAHGARIDERSVGTFGTIGAWSFCQDKIVTTGGEGGMVTTDDESLWASMWSLKDHGKAWSAVYRDDHPPGYRWVHESFGSNWRMLEVQAAIGRIQLRKLDGWTELRTNNARKITEACSQQRAVRVPLPQGSLKHAYYRLYAYVVPEALRSEWSRDRIVAEISARGVPCYQGSCSEVYLERAFDGTPFRPAKRLPVARELGETSLMFLVHPTLTVAEINRTCDVVGEVLKLAAR